VCHREPAFVLRGAEVRFRDQPKRRDGAHVPGGLALLGIHRPARAPCALLRLE
jgi:hypothetical protein